MPTVCHFDKRLITRDTDTVWACVSIGVLSKPSPEPLSCTIAIIYSFATGQEWLSGYFRFVSACLHGAATEQSFSCVYLHSRKIERLKILKERATSVAIWIPPWSMLRREACGGRMLFSCNTERDSVNDYCVDSFGLTLCFCLDPSSTICIIKLGSVALCPPFSRPEICCICALTSTL